MSKSRLSKAREKRRRVRKSKVKKKAKKVNVVGGRKKLRLLKQDND